MVHLDIICKLFLFNLFSNTVAYEMFAVVKAWFPYYRSRSPDRWKYCTRSSTIIWKQFSATGRSSAIILKHFSAIWRSWATLCFSDSSDPAIVSDHIETRLDYALVRHQLKTLTNVRFDKYVTACKMEWACISVNYGGSSGKTGCCTLDDSGVEDEEDKAKSLILHQVVCTSRSDPPRLQ